MLQSLLFSAFCTCLLARFYLASSAEHKNHLKIEAFENSHCDCSTCLYADLAHLVERRLAKAKVAGSSPVIRSIKSKDTPKGVFVFYSASYDGSEPTPSEALLRANFSSFACKSDVARHQENSFVCRSRQTVSSIP